MQRHKAPSRPKFDTVIPPDCFAATALSGENNSDLFALVANAATAITRSNSMQDVLDVFHDAQSNMFGFDTIVYARCVDHLSCFEVEATRSQHTGATTQPCTIEASPVLIEALKRGDLKFIEDTKALQPAVHGLCLPGDDYSACLMPLAAMDGERQFLLCLTKTQNPQSKEHRNLLQMLYSIIQSACIRFTANARLERRVHRDPLTGLYNREYFNGLLETLLTDRQENPFALLLLDLDRFKEINDGFGHLSGDATLIKFGEVLMQLAGTNSTVCRIGGDEFAVLQPLPAGEHLIANQLVEQLRTIDISINLAGKLVDIGFSGGITFCPDDANGRTALMRNADLALYTAKEEPFNALLYFETPMAERYESSRIQISEFKSAIEYDEIVPYYQMLVNLRTGKVEGLEALARWRHPHKGILAPGQFQEIFSHGSLTDLLAREMFQLVARDIANWREHGVPYESIGINVELSDQSNRDLFQTLKDELDSR